MGESLWADLDQWQVDHLYARLGPDGTFSSLVAKLVVATVVRDFREWQNADVWQFPAVIVACSRVLRPANGTQSGAGAPHYRKTYPYSWLAVVEGDSFSAEADAKVLEKRLETAAIAFVVNAWGQSAPIPILPDSSGERLIDIRMGNSNLARFPRASQGDSDPWFGVVSIDLDFITTV